MKAFSKKRHNCYCAFCRSPRHVIRKKNVNVMNIIASALAAGLIMIALWQQPDPRAFVIFVLLLAGAEVFLQIRWRMSLACKSCGFDPILYGKNPQEAAQRVKLHLDHRKMSASTMLARPLNLPTVSPERALALVEEEEKRKARPGGVLSRSI